MIALLFVGAMVCLSAAFIASSSRCGSRSQRCVSACRRLSPARSAGVPRNERQNRAPAGGICYPAHPFWTRRGSCATARPAGAGGPPPQASHESPDPQHRHHRARRPRQDHAGRQPAAAVRHLRAHKRRAASASWIRTTSSASAASPSSPRTAPSTYGGTRINIVDTPGHADFGGEVERVLVDGRRRAAAGRCGRRPDAADALRDAARRSRTACRPIVVVNKIDRDEARPGWVLDQTFDLFDRLGATDAQLDFPVIYASALHGWAGPDSTERDGDMPPLFETIVEHVPPPAVDVGRAAAAADLDARSTTRLRRRASASAASAAARCARA